MSKYRRLKEAAHLQVCEWMRHLEWSESLDAAVLRGCAMSFFRRRHDKVAKFKRATTAWNKRQTVSNAAAMRKYAISALARAEIAENKVLF